MRRPPHAPGRPRAYAPDPAAPPVGLRHARLRRAGRVPCAEVPDQPAATTGGSAWSMCAPTTLLGLLQRHVARARSKRSCAPTPPGSARPGRSAASAPHAWEDEVLRDPLHVLAAARMKTAAAGPTRDQAPAELREPLATLGLTWPTTLDAVKTPLQGTGEAASSGRQRRQPRRRGTSEDHQSRLCGAPLPAGTRDHGSPAAG